LIFPPLVDNKYHVSWGTSNGVVGVVVSIDTVNKTVVMKSPRTHIHWKNPVKWSDLRYIRREEHKLFKK
jgi:hypothetical protein